MAITDLMFPGQSINYDPTKSTLMNKQSGGTSSLGGAGYQAYLKPMSNGGIGSYNPEYDWKNTKVNFGQGEASYSANNYKPTQSDTLGGTGSGTTGTIENGGQTSIGQNWANMSDKDKSGLIQGGIGLLAQAFGGNQQQQQQAPMIQAPQWRPHATQLDMNLFSARRQTQQRQQ